MAVEVTVPRSTWGHYRDINSRRGASRAWTRRARKSSGDRALKEMFGYVNDIRSSTRDAHRIRCSSRVMKRLHA